MSSQYSIWDLLPEYVQEAEKRNDLTATFRRLDGDKQKQIILTVIDALSESPAGINIKSVAKQASVSIGSLYQYFGSSDAMVGFCAGFCAYAIEMSFSFFAAYFDELSLGDALRVYVSEGIKWSGEERAVLKLFARCAYHGDEQFRESLVRPVSDSMRGLLGRIFDNAAVRGELKSGIDKNSALRLVNGFLTSLADSALLPHLNIYFGYFSHENTEETEAQINAAVDFILRSIAAEQPSEHSAGGTI